MPFCLRIGIGMLYERNGQKRGFRPRGEAGELFSTTGEDDSMNELLLNHYADESLAKTVRGIFEWLKPRIEAVLPRDEPPAKPAPAMLTPTEAARQMKLHVQTVRQWCREGKLGVKAGRKWLINPDEVKQYLRGQLLIKGRLVG